MCVWTLCVWGRVWKRKKRVIDYFVSSLSSVESWVKSHRLIDFYFVVICQPSFFYIASMWKLKHWHTTMHKESTQRVSFIVFENLLFQKLVTMNILCTILEHLRTLFTPILIFDLMCLRAFVCVWGSKKALLETFKRGINLNHMSHNWLSFVKHITNNLLCIFF